MGNSNNRIKKPISNNTEKIIAESLQFCNSFDVPQYYRSLLMRIYIQKQRQSHIIDALMNMNDETKQSTKIKYKLNDRQQKFLDQLQNAQIQILDSLYEHSIVYKDTINNESSLFSCKQFQFSDMNNCYEMVRNTNRIQLIDLRENIEKIEKYEQLKQIGLNMIRDRKVCFLMLAGESQLDCQQNLPIQCKKIPYLPSKKSLVQILLRKLDALAKLCSSQIFLFILVSKNKQKYYHQYNKKQFNHLVFEFIPQINLGLLNQKGQIIINQNNHVLLGQVGSGDFWNCILSDKVLRQKLSKFQFLQIFGTSNLLQQCFDCYMLGKAHQQQAPWIISASKNFIDPQFPTIHINQKQQLRIIYPSQRIITEKSPYTFLNHSIIRISCLSQILRQYPEELKEFRIKYKHLSERKIKSISFQKDYTDIFKTMSKKYSNLKGYVIVMSSQDFFYPFYDNTHLHKASYIFSKQYCNWLEIQYKEGNIVEIDPFVSLAGQNLQEEKQFLKQLDLNIQFPLYLQISQQEL